MSSPVVEDEAAEHHLAERPLRGEPLSAETLYGVGFPIEAGPLSIWNNRATTKWDA